MRAVTVSFTTSAGLRDRIDAIADSAQVNRSWLISRVLEGWAAAIDREAGNSGIDRAVALAVAEAVELGQDMAL